MAVQDLERIEQKIDRTVAGAVTISDSVGGIMFQNMSEVLEFAKLMAVSDKAVPNHLRGNPGACLAITIQALEWRSSPFAVANKSYCVNDRIAYEAQLVHAIIEARAPLKERLRFEFIGEGADRQCKVVGHFKGETTPVDLTTPKLRDIKVQNSPLWKSDPDQQFTYYGSRAFARRYCPDVLLGIYTEEELKETGGTAATAVDITPQPSVGARLKGNKGKSRGFSEAHVTEQTAAAAAPAEPAIPEDEAPLARGTRLLNGLTEPEDVTALQESIAEELPEADRQGWAEVCEAKAELLKVQKAA